MSHPAFDFRLNLSLEDADFHDVSKLKAIAAECISSPMEFVHLQKLALLQTVGFGVGHKLGKSPSPDPKMGDAGQGPFLGHTVYPVPGLPWEKEGIARSLLWPFPPIPQSPSHTSVGIHAMPPKRER